MEPTPAGGAPQPFADEPARFAGCGKPLVIGCLLLLIVLGVGLIYGLMKVKSLLAWSIDKYRQQVVASLPEDLDAGERQRLEDAFAAAIAAIEAGELDPVALQKLQGFLAAPPAAGSRMPRQRVLELIEVLEDLAGGGERAPPAAAPRPAEA